VGFVIEQLRIYPVRIPMRQPFIHAGKRRGRTASVLVSIDARGVRGWGEGAPRGYVTGESVDSVVKALSQADTAMLDKTMDLGGGGDFAEAIRALARWSLARWSSLGHYLADSPAAAAALELALFDLLCKLHGRPGIEALRMVPETAALLRPEAEPTSVSLVLDLASDPITEAVRLGPDKVAAIRHLKLKADADIEACLARVGAARAAFGPRVLISVDANGAWSAPEAVRAACALRLLDIAWIEEPLAPRDWNGLRAVRQDGGVPVMLDESCTGIADLALAAGHDAVDYVNVRVSKCGGLFPALALAAQARERGLGAQLGVHVGEVGPLWAAGRLLACGLAGLAAAEAGRQDEWFPEPLTQPPYRVDRIKNLAPPLTGPGLGVEPTAALLQRCPAL
jgi:L-alanine-DL-glutamate epimerase-like enolase superfamily enzyme